MVRVLPTLLLAAIALIAAPALAAPTHLAIRRDLVLPQELSGRDLQYFEARTDPKDKKKAEEKAALQAKCQAAMAQIQQGIKINEALAKACKSIGYAIKNLAS